MNKRSAMMVAGGLVLALLVAGMAVATGFTGPEAAANSSRVSRVKPEPQKPEIHTITRTITVHKKADAPQSSVAPAPVVVTQTQAPVAPASSDPSGYEDDGYGDDDQYEGEDHEGEDHEDAADHEDTSDHEGEDD